jgi:hypothetical protein
MTSYNVYYLGYGSQAQPSLVHDDLLLLIIQKLTGKKVKLSSNIKDADLVIAYPYITSSLFFKFKWLLSMLAATLHLIDRDAINLRWLLGVKNKKVLFVSHENLNRPYWWNMLGKFLITSNLPRLTFWPTEVDPSGERFPYWYNYIDWPSYSRNAGYPRFGRLYKISELCSPLSPTPNRLDRVITISSHLDHPRSALLKTLQLKFNIDVFGAAGSRLDGPKLDVMQRYKFAFCPENSAGFGYETEKIPEAWVAGCIPIGIFLNPFSQFNPKLVSIDPFNPESYINLKLLEHEPSLSEIENYVRKII